ncbi:hypothetical protein H634G_06350 [Metarhizium anisopliae BRIP 53293]|uniref:Extracellular membrane protein CFEM domain-containing protein n=1 Tax=Metarhizium anisopliae BRIP 53293 TaxID=1291518 RepID=A0A0D9NWL8_METAN|nr:hypothetical protein H634G_06350 [Metarhizium anisopliae BRIP 53293]KJK88829.1 hypothetical protein H633G_07304 [Metarhizium anisopliae BRIP 53284]
MRLIATFMLSVQLALGLNSFTVDSDCDSLLAQALDGGLPQPVHWAKAGCQQALVCKSDPTKDCCISRIKNGLTLPLRYDDAVPYYEKCAGVSVPKPRKEDDIVLPSISCELIRNFRCGLGFASEFCDIVYAELDGCKKREQCSKQTEQDNCCGAYPAKNPEAVRRYYSKCLGTCNVVTEKVVEQEDCLAVGE